MIEQGSIKEFEWIKQGARTIMSSSYGTTVDNLLPNKFDRYIKILHPIYKYKLSQEKVIFDYDRLDNEGVSKERILWRQLAEEYNVQFKPEINEYAFFKENNGEWPSYFLRPEDGTLEKEEVYEIVNILKSLNCEKYFYYYDIVKPSILLEGNLEIVLELIKLDETREFYEKILQSSPTYWWDEDKTVCICSDWDLSFTIIGCNNKLFTSFMKSKYLECIEVTYDTRIDYEAME